jgi:hypothetical protein
LPAIATLLKSLLLLRIEENNEKTAEIKIELKKRIKKRGKISNKLKFNKFSTRQI